MHAIAVEHLRYSPRPCKRVAKRVKAAARSSDCVVYKPCDPCLATQIPAALQLEASQRQGSLDLWATGWRHGRHRSPALQGLVARRGDLARPASALSHDSGCLRRLCGLGVTRAGRFRQGAAAARPEQAMRSPFCPRGWAVAHDSAVSPRYGVDRSTLPASTGCASSPPVGRLAARNDFRASHGSGTSFLAAGAGSAFCAAVPAFGMALSATFCGAVAKGPRRAIKSVFLAGL